MNIYSEHFPKEIFHNLKNQDLLSNKLKVLPFDINSIETHQYSKENVSKINCSKHEFKTPAIVHSHKLPKAFKYSSNSRFDHEKQQEKLKSLDHNQETNDKFEEKEIIKNIFIAEKKTPSQAIKIVIKNEKNEIKQEKKPFKLIKNPIIPLKNFFKIAKKNEDDLFHDTSTVKLIESRCNKLEMNLKKPIDIQTDERYQLNEMVTLSIINSTNENNQIKIMLHIPSLKPFVIREESMINIQNFHPRKKILSIWKNNFNLSENFLHIFELLWNYPEGSSSIICELRHGGSLKDLSEFTGSLNETMLKSLAFFLLKAYKEFHSITKTSLGTLSLSQILFDDQGCMKIGPKVLQNSPASSPKSNNFDNWRYLFSKIKPMNNANTGSINDDFFEIGMVLLYCAIGDIDLIETHAGSGDFRKNNGDFREDAFMKSETNFFLNNRRKELEKGEENMDFNKEIIGSSCCFLHLLWDLCEEQKIGEYLKKRHSSSFFKAISRKNGALMKSIIEKKFSKEFVDFICCCLKFDQNLKYENLINHCFFNNNIGINGGNNVGLKEIVRISSNWHLNQTSYVLKDKIGHIIQSICVVLEEKNINKEKFFEGKNMEKLTVELGNNLGMSQKAILEIITQSINDL